MAEFEISRTELDGAKAVFEKLYERSAEAYDAWWPAIPGGVLSLVQDPSAPVGSAAQLYWDQFANPAETMTRAIMATLRAWPAHLDKAWNEYRTSDTVSAAVLFAVHDEL